MVLAGILKRFTDKIAKQVKSTIKPASLVFFKDRRPRDENYYHYRYPSPGSSPVGLDADKDVNYRLGYRDSVHNIRNASHYVNQTPNEETRSDYNIHSKNQTYIDGSLIRAKQDSCSPKPHS